MHTLSSGLAEPPPLRKLSDDGAEILGSGTAFFSTCDESFSSGSVCKDRRVLINSITIKGWITDRLISQTKREEMIVNSTYGQTFSLSVDIYEIPASFPCFLTITLASLSLFIQLPQIACFEIYISFS